MSTILPSQPWRLLILDRTPDDPRWLIVTVSIPDDIRPALLDAEGRYTGWRAAAEWVESLLGQRVELVPVTGPVVWTIRPAVRKQPREEH